MSTDHSNIAKTYEAALVAANRNPEYVGELIADFTRKLMGQSISMSPSHSQVTAAFSDILGHIVGFDQQDLFDAIRSAEDSLRVDHTKDRYLAAAQSGTRFLLASAARDGYSAARASKARSTFREDMRLALGIIE